MDYEKLPEGGMKHTILLLYLKSQINKLPHSEAVKAIRILTGASNLTVLNHIKKVFHTRFRRCSCGEVFNQPINDLTKNCGKCEDIKREKSREYHRVYQLKYYHDYKHLIQYDY